MAKQIDKSVDPQMLKVFLEPLTSPEHLKNWISVFFEIDLPMGYIDPNSNSSPVEAMYEAYAAYRDDKCLEVPGYIWLASRAGIKTLSGAMLNVLLIVHFKAQIAHIAAVKKQAEKNLEYTNIFIKKTKHYIEAAGRKIVGDSKTKIQIQNEDNTVSYVDVIVASLAGGNSQRGTVLSADELDTLSSQGEKGYRESLLIPTQVRGKGPLQIKYSTRKFAFGIFEKEIQNRENTGEQLRCWNIFDITQHCPKTRHLPELPKEVRYIASELPQRNISVKEFENLLEKDKKDFYNIEAYAGCASCPLLQNCEMRLAHRPEGDTGGLYNTIDFTIRQFRITSPDMASAQLLCRKPSLSGLIYPRFTSENVLSIEEAYEKITAVKKIDLDNAVFANYIKNSGLPVYAGVDWGSKNEYAVMVGVLLPNNILMIVDTFAAPGLESEDWIKIASEMKEKWNIKTFYCDNAYPFMTQAFNKRGMQAPKVDKDVDRGIEAVRSRIVDASNVRRIFFVDCANNRRIIAGMQTYHWKLDAIGNTTDKPDHTEESDIMDALRYLCENLFSIKKSVMTTLSSPSGDISEIIRKQKDPLGERIRELASEDTSKSKNKGGVKILW